MLGGQAGILFGTGQSTIIDALTNIAAGVPAYAFDPGRSAGLWNDNFARPVMPEGIDPLVKEYLSAMQKAASEFLEGQIVSLQGTLSVGGTILINGEHELVIDGTGLLAFDGV